MANTQGTPRGSPAAKYKEDPISALNEHFHKEGGKLQISFHGQDSTAQDPNPWVCVLQTPEPKGTFKASGWNMREAKRKAAFAACQNLFA